MPRRRSLRPSVALTIERRMRRLANRTAKGIETKLTGQRTRGRLGHASGNDVMAGDRGRSGAERV